MRIIRERNGVAVIEDDGAYYTVGLSRPDMQVSSLGRECPAGGGQWVARFSRSGLDYVSHARTRKSAMDAFFRYARYCEDVA